LCYENAAKEKNDHTKLQIPTRSTVKYQNNHKIVIAIFDTA